MQFVPKMNVTMTVPSRPADMAARLHNKFAKEALRETLQSHHRRTFRGRFEPAARSKYDHAPRSPRYVKHKKNKFGHTIDLVYTGATRREFVKPGHPVRIGGTAAGGTLVGRMIFKFPFADGNRMKAGQRRTRNPRTAQLAKEISAWTAEEAKTAAQEFLQRYMEKVTAWRGTRKRSRLPTK